MLSSLRVCRAPARVATSFSHVSWHRAAAAPYRLSSHPVASCRVASHHAASHGTASRRIAWQTKIHERCPIFIGSAAMVDEIEALFKEDAAAEAAGAGAAAAAGGDADMAGGAGGAGAAKA